MDNELDALISKYTNDLIKLKEKWNQWGIVTEEAPLKAAIQYEETAETDESDNSADLTEEPPSENSTEDTAVKPDEEQENLSPASDLPLAEPESFALFTAKVYSGNQAYAVPDAKISIYLDGKLHAFLITDENGSTKQIKLEAYPKLNSFIPESTQ
jgi:hypothetical protein